MATERRSHGEDRSFAKRHREDEKRDYDYKIQKRIVFEEHVYLKIGNRMIRIRKEMDRIRESKALIYFSHPATSPRLHLATSCSSCSISKNQTGWT